MKRHVFWSMMSCVILIGFLFYSCGRTSQDDGFISGAARQKQKMQEMVAGTATIVYRVPAMSEVRVKIDKEYGENRYMDVYYPPGYNFSTKIPVVIVVNGLAGIKAKNMGRFMDWGLLLAAKGVIGVT